ncbi:MAG: DUF2764 domain-containing protein [Bacteroidales bacterium]|nr:DUF2764 domain-containing protein [Bacteroidales bacterium]
MTNYHYTVASLPAISQDWKFGGKTFDQIINEIKTTCDKDDIALIDFVLSGFNEDNLTPEFYREAIDGGNGFLREYYSFDLGMRNAKVTYLNKALGRPIDKDILDPETENVCPPPATDGVFETNDILARERAVDDMYWTELNKLIELHYFDMSVVLSFILKLHIIDRWNVLDETTGRELFRKLVDEVRGTFQGVKFDASPAGKERRLL